MAEQTKVLRSEHTKDMSPEELAELQEKVGQMSEEELKAFRNSMNPDDMDQIAEAIAMLIDDHEANTEKAKAIVKELTDKYPLY